MPSSELMAEISADIDACSASAHRNYALAYILLGLGLIATAAAALVSANDDIPGSVRGTVAVLPGLFALASNTLRLEQRSRYCWKRVREDQAVLRRMRYENIPDAQASQEFSAALRRLEEELPAFGALPARPVAVGP